MARLKSKKEQLSSMITGTVKNEQEIQSTISQLDKLVYKNRNFNGNKKIKILLMKLQEFAKKGFCKAQFEIAQQYDEFGKTPTDLRKAFFWYKKAAEQNHSNACNMLGTFYNYGRGCKLSLVKALKWYKKSAYLGNDLGQYNYALCLQNGEGTRSDLNNAKIWFKRSISNGSDHGNLALAILYLREGTQSSYKKAFNILIKISGDERDYYLGEIFEYGLGTKVDFKKAIKYYERSSSRGCILADFALVRMHLNGKFIPRNFDKAQNLFFKLRDKSIDQRKFKTR